MSETGLFTISSMSEIANTLPIASALATRLGQQSSRIRVTVIPRPLPMDAPDVPGYDARADQIRILAGSIELDSDGAMVATGVGDG